MFTVDLNADVGEGMSQDELLFPLITSANISCGYHAGDDETIRKSVLLAQEHSVAIGAHPSFADPQNFGRRRLNLPPAEIFKLVKDQLLSFIEIARKQGAYLHHVKPHGALYNMAAADDQVAAAIVEAVRITDPKLILYGLSGSKLLIAGNRAGLTTVSEVFADREYESDGSLRSREHNDAVIKDVFEAAVRVVRMLKEGTVRTLTGEVIGVQAESICIHGDNFDAVYFAETLHEVFSKEQITIAAPNSSVH